MNDGSNGASAGNAKMIGPIARQWRGPRSISNKSELFAYLAEDARACGEKTASQMLASPIGRFLVLLRIAEYGKNCFRSFVGSIVAESISQLTSWYGRQLGFTVPLFTTGAGLCLAHPGTIVINEGARIGSNCRIHVDVVLGMSHGGVPTLGDNIYIGPGAKIYGDIFIGDGSVIGANAVVGRTMPAHSLILGSPARRVKEARRWP